MKAAEITDRVAAEIAANKYPFIRLNYPNGDMVGHTGVYQATQIAVETVDALPGAAAGCRARRPGNPGGFRRSRLMNDMYEHDKTGAVILNPDTGRPKAKTSRHSLNPVGACF